MKANFTDSNTRSNLFKWSDLVYPPGANIYPAMGSFSRGNCRPELRGYVRNFLAVIRLKRDFDDFGRSRLRALSVLDQAAPPRETPGFKSKCISVFSGRLHDQDWFSFSVFVRRRSSSFRISGVSSVPKSPILKIGRVSISPSTSGLSGSFGIRFAHSSASSIEFTFQIQKPAISSRVSANGPSVTIRL